MNQGVKDINLIFEDGSNIIIDDFLFSNLYISNIDEEANEIPYEKLMNTNILYANYFSLKIKHIINEHFNKNLIDEIITKKNLCKIVLNTGNSKITFNIASTIDPFKENKINLYDQSFIDDENLCLLITPYNIKYKKHLFI